MNDYLFIPVKISLKLFIFKSGILHGNITVIMIIIVFNYPLNIQTVVFHNNFGHFHSKAAKIEKFSENTVIS